MDNALYFTRDAILDDIDAISDMLGRFAKESSLPLTFDPDLARLILETAINSRHAVVVVYQANTVLAGVAFGTVEEDFTIEKCAFLNKFYIEQEFRGMGIGGELLAAFDQRAKAIGASISFASATAGMGDDNEAAYVRLFERNSYTVLGRIIARTYDEQDKIVN